MELILRGSAIIHCGMKVNRRAGNQLSAGDERYMDLQIFLFGNGKDKTVMNKNGKYKLASRCSAENTRYKISCLCKTKKGVRSMNCNNRC